MLWRRVPKQSAQLAQKAAEIADDIDYDFGLANAYYNLALSEWEQGQYDKSLSNLLQSGKIFKDLNNLLYVGKVDMLTALVYDDLGEYEKSLSIYYSMLNS
ncbi:MAG: tetratricopeptide repeat protein, partial [Bacteroidota bacterium]